ncbi:MotA/TolQ/ExbB proton channel family protein [Lentisalinibacter sediminis]|uniref:MotA/TolQ/ExbB proton channel family protein n=1 Tax=Lentisalinibacter sediminis TaxID=2992237 RepID=UPI00386F9EA6
MMSASIGKAPMAVRAAGLIALAMAVAVAVAAGAGTALAQDAPRDMDELLQTVREQGQRLSQENRQREQEFLQKRDQQQALLDSAKRALTEEEQRSERLKTQFDENERQLEELNETLRIRVGDMGELFGVVRQTAGEVNGMVDTSLITAEYPDRGEIATELASARDLPSIADLKSLQVLILEEMAGSGDVDRFAATIRNAAGQEESAEVVRVGLFNVITGDRFLQYDPAANELQELARQPDDRFRSLAENLYAAREGNARMAVDPSRGALLSLVVQSPSLGERVNQGGTVGYVIIAIGCVGLLIALWRLLALLVTGRKLRSQLKRDGASEGNPLGRILKVFEDNRHIDTETLELKLDEAILRETPRLEQGQGWIKVIAAVAPLLGLLGTVVGMIRTFQAITLFGTGDPKLMAGGISQALVTTVLGLVVAIPLVFLHSLVAARSRAMVEVLEEQSAGMIARHSERGV